MLEQKLQITTLPSDTTCEYNFKTVIIGEPGVGKSSIISRGVNNIFTNDYKTTVCFDHSWKNYKVNDLKIRIQLWDTCGQEMYHSIIKNFYKNALCIFIVFAINNIKSFKALSFWIKEIEDVSSEGIIIFLIGNKNDIKNEKVVSDDEINKFIKENNIKKYFETSAANGDNINNLFEETVKELYFKHISPLINYNESRVSTNSNVISNDEFHAFNLENQDNENEEICKNCVLC